MGGISRRLRLSLRCIPLAPDPRPSDLLCRRRSLRLFAMYSSSDSDPETSESGSRMTGCCPSIIGPPPPLLEPRAVEASTVCGGTYMDGGA